MTPAPLAAGPETDARIAEAMTEIDHEWTDCPVCPKCGFTEQDWWDGLDIDVGDGQSTPRSAQNVPRHIPCKSPSRPRSRHGCWRR